MFKIIEYILDELTVQQKAKILVRAGYIKEDTERVTREEALVQLFHGAMDDFDSCDPMSFFEFGLDDDISVPSLKVLDIVLQYVDKENCSMLDNSPFAISLNDFFKWIKHHPYFDTIA